MKRFSALTYLTGKTTGSPALLFEHIKDSMAGSSVLINVLGSSLKRFALIFGSAETCLSFRID
jgi:3-polyprenyl-4-hydroxybenzoate decarboxylase